LFLEELFDAVKEAAEPGRGELVRRTLAMAREAPLEKNPLQKAVFERDKELPQDLVEPNRHGALGQEELTSRIQALPGGIGAELLSRAEEIQSGAVRFAVVRRHMAEYLTAGEIRAVRAHLDRVPDRADQREIQRRAEMLAGLAAIEEDQRQS